MPYRLNIACVLKLLRAKPRLPAICGVVLLGLLTVLCRSTMATPPAPLSWVTGYWFSPPVYGRLPVSKIDYSALTHIIHYAVLPSSDGTLESKSLGNITAYASDLIQTSHQNGVQVLLGVGQTASGGDFKNATSPDNLDNFISNIMSVVDLYGYDGVDIDWENGIDTGRFTNLVNGLRTQLDARPTRGLLTGAFWNVCCSIDTLQDAFDQINVMTYDNCAISEGFSSYNSPLYNSGDPRRRTVDWRIRQFIAKIQPAKLGLGIPFYGYVWRGGSGAPTGGITAPGQSWTSPPTMTAIDYRNLVSNASLWQDSYKRRDLPGGVPYLSIDLPGSNDDVFVTYEDEISVAKKVAYASSLGLGGVMIYELSADYLSGQEPSHPLLEAIKNALPQ